MGSPCQLGTQSGRQADGGTVGPSVISTVAEMTLELLGLGLRLRANTKQGEGRPSPEIVQLGPSEYRIRCSRIRSQMGNLEPLVGQWLGQVQGDLRWVLKAVVGCGVSSERGGSPEGF